MARSIEFWFDYTCPYAYLASTRIRALAARIGAECYFRPMLLGGIFRARNVPQNLAGTLSPAKARHNAEDISRWADLFGCRLVTPPNHPIRSVEALRVTLAADNNEALIANIYAAYWAEGNDISNETVLRRALEAANLDADAVIEKAKSQTIKDELRKNTEHAIELGIFGAPSFLVDGKELFFGQDRMFLIAGERMETFFAQERSSTRKTSARKLEVFFDFSSPYAYFGSELVKGVAERTGAHIEWCPIFLGGLFKSIGQVDVPLLSWSEAKRHYTFVDLARSAKAYGLPFEFPTQFPMISVKALRCFLALEEHRRGAFQDQVFRAYWAEGRDISSDVVLGELIGDGAETILARTREQGIKDELIERTKRAAERGIFGVPTFIVDDTQLFWGQDRLSLVERALTR